MCNDFKLRHVPAANEKEVGAFGPCGCYKKKFLLMLYDYMFIDV